MDQNGRVTVRDCILPSVNGSEGWSVRSGLKCLRSYEQMVSCIIALISGRWLEHSFAIDGRRYSLSNAQSCKRAGEVKGRWWRITHREKVKSHNSTNTLAYLSHLRTFTYLHFPSSNPINTLSTQKTSPVEHHGRSPSGYCGKLRPNIKKYLVVNPPNSTTRTFTIRYSTLWLFLLTRSTTLGLKVLL